MERAVQEIVYFKSGNIPIDIEGHSLQIVILSLERYLFGGAEIELGQSVTGLGNSQCRIWVVRRPG